MGPQTASYRALRADWGTVAAWLKGSGRLCASLLQRCLTSLAVDARVVHAGYFMGCWV